MSEQEKMNRADLIAELKTMLRLEDDNLPWATLCKHTKFDSFATALAFGFNWQNPDMQTMPEANLRMAIFNIRLFPKELAA
jgi:hypothetical protein